MKNIITLFLFLVLSSSMAFSTTVVNDNTGKNSDGKKNGAGSFAASVIKPIKVTVNNSTVFLGTFVKGLTYSHGIDANFENTILDFTIEGEEYHPFSITITPNTTGTIGGIATIKIKTEIVTDDGMGGMGDLGGPAYVELTVPQTFDNVFDENGNFTFSLSCEELTAITAGTETFVQTITVNYKDL
jgi:hypothetical protein